MGTGREAVAGVVIALAGCTACTETHEQQAEPAPRTPAASSVATPSAPLSARLPAPLPATLPAPLPAEAAATIAGPLSIDSFPAPADLGTGWGYRVDAGDPEAAFVGNGTPGLQRDPEEVAALAVPLGCRRDQPMPTPAHAFEVDYTFQDRPVVAVRMAFADEGTAKGFFAARVANLRACLGRSGGAATGPLVGSLRRAGDGAVLSDRTPESESWTELAIRRGQDVLLVAARSSFGQAPLRRADVDAIQLALGGTR